MLLKQYGKLYIRHMAPSVKDIYQIQVSTYDRDRVFAQYEMMEYIVNRRMGRQEKKPYDLKVELMLYYIDYYHHYPLAVASQYLNLLMLHEDIRTEFYEFVLNERMPGIVKVAGMTVRDLQKKYYLDDLECYLTLVYLKHETEDTLEDLEKIKRQ